MILFACFPIVRNFWLLGKEIFTFRLILWTQVYSVTNSLRCDCFYDILQLIIKVYRNRGYFTNFFAQSTNTLAQWFSQPFSSRGTSTLLSFLLPNLRVQNSAIYSIFKEPSRVFGETSVFCGTQVEKHCLAHGICFIRCLSFPPTKLKN